jgi:hypothetical protein
MILNEKNDFKDKKNDFKDKKNDFKGQKWASLNSERQKIC